MKKLLLTLFCLFAMFTVKAQCDYTLSGTDSWGDGWNGATIDIDVAGVTSSFTVSGSSNSVTIPSYTGDIVTFAFNSGSYDYEIGITLTGPDGTSLYASGAPALDGIFITDTSASTCAAPNCLEPATLTLSNIIADGAEVSFDSGNTTPSDNYEYELVNTSNGEVADGSTDGTATTTTITLSGLTQNDNYEIYIKEICGAGDESSYTSVSWYQTELPGCASNFSPADGSTVYGLPTRFTWDAPTTGGAATSYDFYYGLNGAVADQFLGNYTSTTVYVNFPAGNHNYLIVPKNVNGAAAVSCSSVNFTIASTTTPPSPAGLTCDAGDVSTSQFTESFDAAGSWSGDFGGAGGWQFDTDSTTSGSTGPTGPQDTGGSYMFYEASSAVGSASVVSPVIDLSGIAAGNGAELSFYMHAYGSAMGTLNVGASTSATGPFTNLFTWGGQLQTTSATAWSQVGADVSAYTGGDLYIQFTMTTRGSFYSDMSIDTMEVVACDTAPTCLIPTTLTATISSGGATTIDWVDPNDPVVNDFDYELLDVTAGETATGVPTGQVTTNSVDLTSLVEDNNYQLLVRTACSRGGLSGESYSDWSTALSWTQTELPGCPTNVTPIDGATDQSWQSVTLTWDAPTTGGTATSYSVLYGTTEAGMVEVGTTTNTTFTLNGLNSGATVFIGVNAINAGGSSASCTANSITTNTDGLSCATPVEVFEGTNTQDILSLGQSYAYYSYTATTAGSLTVDSCGQGVDTYLQTLDDGCTALTGTYDDGCSSGYGSTFTVDVLPNDVINFRFVWYWTGSNVDHDFNITLTPTCSGTTTTWDGTAWSNGAPDANSYAIMSGAYSTGTNGDVTACVMQVDADVTIDGSTDAAISEVLVMAGNTLTIDETSSLTVSGDFTNNGTVTLNSTADDYSSLIVTGTASGNITYNRYVNVYDDTLGGG